MKPFSILLFGLACLLQLQYFLTGMLYLFFCGVFGLNFICLFPLIILLILGYLIILSFRKIKSNQTNNSIVFSALYLGIGIGVGFLVEQSFGYTLGLLPEFLLIKFR